MSDEPITKNGEVLCVECKGRYVTSEDSFNMRRNRCPRCNGWQAMWLKDTDADADDDDGEDDDYDDDDDEGAG